MLLLTCREWLGTQTHAGSKERERFGSPRVTNVAFGTNLALGEAILELYRHQEEFKTRFPNLAVEYTLLSVSTIDPVSFDVLSKVGVGMIENLWRNKDA